MLKNSSYSQSKDQLRGWRRRAHEIIFESDTAAGRAFDVGLIILIMMSLGAVVLESMASLRAVSGRTLRAAEWFFTIVFSIEYIFRLITVGRPMRYALSFYGIIDLLAVAPTYLSLLLPGAQYLLAVRIVRILRIFRILKLAQYLSEANIILLALRASKRKIIVFLFAVLTLVTVLGSLMYLVEGEENGFTSIPVSVYWAIVTLTTVGYGDISPRTALGQALASFIMILGYAILAVPTGIVTAEFTRASLPPVSGQACPSCGIQGHDMKALYCKHCGAKL
ncbi:MAG: ion transporter [Acidobacteria bacterium]|nr:ion transporter [Acidobacteriota bacterium]